MFVSSARTLPGRTQELARVLRKMGRKDEALALLQDALAARRRRFGRFNRTAVASAKELGDAFGVTVKTLDPGAVLDHKLKNEDLRGVASGAGLALGGKELYSPSTKKLLLNLAAAEESDAKRMRHARIAPAVYGGFQVSFRRGDAVPGAHA